ncbi:MAG: molybdopterin-guanine dinucleotide biosynthesis protein B, partial [Thiohalocapsa sp.]
MPTKNIPIVGFVAPSGTGKTTLLRKLVPLLRERGLGVGYLKHTHHSFQIDTPGKDSYEIAEAGAAQVMVASSAGWALMDQRPAATMDLADAEPADYAARFDVDALDLLLVEGFHRSHYPKIEVHRASSGKPPMYPDDGDIIAVATDRRLPGDAHPPELPID